MKKYKLKLQRVIATGEEEVEPVFNEIVELESIPGDKLYEYSDKPGFYKILSSEEIMDSGESSERVYKITEEEAKALLFNTTTPLKPDFPGLTLNPDFVSPVMHSYPSWQVPGAFIYPNFYTYTSSPFLPSGKYQVDSQGSLSKGPLLKPEVKPEHNADYYLQKAQEALKARGQLRDKPTGERSMESTVATFNALTGHNLTEQEGWEFMILLKMVRGRQGVFNADDYCDGPAYFALLGECNAKKRV